MHVRQDPPSGGEPGWEIYSTSPAFKAVAHVPQFPARHPESIATSLSSANSSSDPASGDHVSVLPLFENVIFISEDVSLVAAGAFSAAWSASFFLVTVAGPKAS